MILIIDNNNNNNNNNKNNNDNMNKNKNNPETIKYRVGVRRAMVCFMDRKNSSALGGNLSRDGVSIKILVFV